MPTQPVYVTLVLCTITLFSCNNKKAIRATANASNAVKAFDDLKLRSDEAINLAAYANEFTQTCIQKFTAATHKISVITAKNGLRLTIDPSILEKEDGSAIDEKIAVSIIELTTSQDLFKSNAATVSNGRLLASGGSYFIGMECSGKPLRIKKNKSLQVEFPVLNSNEMELFYGQRDADLNMNWTSAGVNLKQQPIKQELYEEDGLNFTDSNRYVNTYPAFALDENKQPKIYRTLNETVYYYEKKMTIKDIVDTINRYTAKIYIDTVNTWPKPPAQLLPGQKIDTNYLYKMYGPSKQFIIKKYKDIKAEAEKLAKEKREREEALEKWQPKDIAGQLQKYYSPSAITTLGWLNCDRFYRNPQNIDIPMELPITFSKGSVQYFIIFKSFNGLINGKQFYSEDKKMALLNLPVNEPITLIAFTKSNGQLFHCKEDIIVERNKVVKLDFKNISAEEISKIFGKNVRI